MRVRVCFPSSVVVSRVWVDAKDHDTMSEDATPSAESKKAGRKRKEALEMTCCTNNTRISGMLGLHR